MGFRYRQASECRLAELLDKYYWNRLAALPCAILVHPYGYEGNVSQPIRTVLTGLTSVTAKYIRFTPDRLLLREGGLQGTTGRASLLEYKCTLTPRFSEGENQWRTGQMEADAWENYLRITSMGVELAVLIYCPFHRYPLLCDFVCQHWQCRQRAAPSQSTGSGTDYINIDLGQVRTLETFMESEFEVPVSTTRELLNRTFWEEVLACDALRVSHHRNSPCTSATHPTGWNWDAEMCHGAGLRARRDDD